MHLRDLKTVEHCAVGLNDVMRFPNGWYSLTETYEGELDTEQSESTHISHFCSRLLSCKATIKWRGRNRLYLQDAYFSWMVDMIVSVIEERTKSYCSFCNELCFDVTMHIEVGLNGKLNKAMSSDGIIDNNYFTNATVTEQ